MSSTFSSLARSAQDEYWRFCDRLTDAIPHRGIGAAMSRKTIGVQIHLLSTDEGGRSGPLFSGYRSLLRVEGTMMDFGFELELDPECSKHGLAPGTTGTGRLSVWAVEELPSLLRDQKFELRDGTRVVGRGIILDP